jgi:phosphoribosyl 1,2-cyclic phosphodiesterase
VQVTFWGVRGSIATPGPKTVRYGGNTVCVEVRPADNSLIIFDAGTGLRELGDQLLLDGPLPSTIHLLVTHSHWDHIMGAPFFAPMWRKDAHIILHSLSPRMSRSTQRLIMFDGEHFPVARADIPARFEVETHDTGSVRIGSATVTWVELDHPGGSDGYRVADDGGSVLTYLTDNELKAPAAPALARFSEGAGLFIHDAQYVPADMPAKRGWGHSVIPDVLELGRSAGAGVLALFHHDPSRSDDELDIIGFDAAAWAKEHAPGMAAIVAREGLTVDVRPR